MKEFWDDRYRSKEYAYGTEPNEFFKERLEKLNLKGKLLLPAEGEGRNAVYAAKKGLEVTALDISEEGKQKALKLAGKEGVHIDYQVADFMTAEFEKNSFDAVGLIFAHFPPPILKACHSKVCDLIKPGGYVILEGFSTENLPLRKANPAIGGPADEEMLFTAWQIKNHFPRFNVKLLSEETVELDEGKFHQGKGKVIRFVAQKLDLLKLINDALK